MMRVQPLYSCGRQLLLLVIAMLCLTSVKVFIDYKSGVGIGTYSVKGFIYDDSKSEVTSQSPTIPNKTSSRITKLQEGDFPYIEPELCRRTPMLKAGNLSRDFMLCAKSTKIDRWVSGAIVKSGLWETHVVSNFLKFFQLYPEAVFVDLGSNIGAFSVAMAAFGHRVVAVDPIKTNLAYVHASAYLSGVADRITYVYNSINDVDTTLYPWNRDPTNEGGMTLLTENEAKDKNQSLIGIPITSLTFDEIIDDIEEKTVILKVDIEGYECKALHNYMKRTDKKKIIPIMMIEWQNIAINQDGHCPDVESFFKSLQDAGYTAFDDKLKNQVSKNAGAPGNLIWMHKSVENSKTVI